MTDTEISKLHERIDDLVKSVNESKIDIGIIKKTLEMWPKSPEIPSRPCVFFQEHIQAHKDSKTMWQTPAIKVIFDFVKMGIVAVFTYFLARKE